MRNIKIVYIDTAFLYNCALDFLVIYMCCKIMMIKVKIARLAAGSLVGALFSVFAEVFEISPIIKLLLVLPSAFLVSNICFGKRNIKVHIRIVLIMILSSCGLFGFLFALKNFFTQIFKNSNLLDVGIPLPLFIALCSVVSAFLTHILRWSHSKSNQKSVTVQMTVLGQTNTFNLLCDSGNLAFDKFSGNALAIVSQKLIDEKFDNLSENLKCGFDTNKARKLCLHFTPIKTVANESFLLCFKPDECFVICNNTYRSVDICVAIDFKEDSDFCGYEGVFPGRCLDAVI